MTMHAFIFAETDVELWGLSTRRRLERILKKLGVECWIGRPVAPAGDSILLLRGDYLYDERLVQSMTKRHGTVLQIATEAGKRSIAAHVAAEDGPAVRDLLDGKKGAEDFPSLSFETPQTLSGHYQMKLRKIDSPYLLPISEENKRQLEKRLFSGSYKGVTDLVTKWVWPRPRDGRPGCAFAGGSRPTRSPR